MFWKLLTVRLLPLRACMELIDVWIEEIQDISSKWYHTFVFDQQITFAKLLFLNLW